MVPSLSVYVGVDISDLRFMIVTVYGCLSTNSCGTNIADYLFLSSLTFGNYS